MFAHRAGVVEDDIGGIAVGSTDSYPWARSWPRTSSLSSTFIWQPKVSRYSFRRIDASILTGRTIISNPCREVYSRPVSYGDSARATRRCGRRTANGGENLALHEAWDPAKYGFLPHPEERYKWWLGKQAGEQNAVFLVADDGKGRLAGFLIGTVEKEIPIYRLKEFGFIHDLWVEEDFRHEGIGRQLVMAAVEKFATLGMKQVRLDTAAANEPARKLFASCGFRVSTVEMLMEM